MADKETKLSIIIRTVDKATARINAINERLAAATKPLRNFRESLSGLRDKSGLDDVIGGITGVGGALAGIAGKAAIVAGAVGSAVAGLMSLVDGFANLGDKAMAMGVSVDFLAQMRYAAERSGASVDALDSGLKTFNASLGQARAGTGRMIAFLDKVSPALSRQLKAAKGNEAAFDVLAGAMAKLEDPAKRAALAQKTLGDSALAPLFAKGPKAIQGLRDRYLSLAGSQEEAAKKAGDVDDALKDFKASTDGIKAALVEGLSPALKVVVEQMREFFTKHRGAIKEWAASLGKKIPAAIESLKSAFSGVVSRVRPFIDETWKLKVAAVALVGVIVGPLVGAIYSLGAALLTTPVGWIVAGIAAIAAGAYLLTKNWDAVSEFFSGMWDAVKEKFGWATDLIAALMVPFIYFPIKIIANWESITAFFAGLWDDVTGVFRTAWEFIEGIVDKIAGAVSKVTGAASKVRGAFEWVGGLGGNASSVNDLSTKLRSGAPLFGPAPDVRAQALKSASTSLAQPSEARITVDFANAPRGTRVNADPRSTANVDLSVGYQMGAS